MTVIETTIEKARHLVGLFILRVLQVWIRWTGRAADGEAWLDGFAADGDEVGPGILDEVMERHHLVGERSSDCGLVTSFDSLRGPRFDPDDVDPRVHDFYERTAGYALSSAPHWHSPVAAMAKLVVGTTSRLIDQCNLPLDAAGAEAGMTNEVVRMRRRSDGGVAGHACWLRRSKSSGRVVYAGFYGIATPPNADGPCVRVSFPLPNGYACVILRPTVHDDGSLELVSRGEGHGDPGFYLVQRDDDGKRWARRVPLHESIRVGLDSEGELVAVHRFNLWTEFLRLEYALERCAEAGQPGSLVLFSRGA